MFNRKLKLEIADLRDRLRRAENDRDYYKDVLKAYPQMGASKLNPLQVLEMKRLIRAGWKDTTLAARYGIDRRNVSQVRHGRTWAWLDDVEYPRG